MTKDKLYQKPNYLSEIILRIIFAILFITLEYGTPFHREIQPEEMWLYRNPRTRSYFPSSSLWLTVFLVPLCLILVVYRVRRDWGDVSQALLAVSLAWGLNGVLTNVIKLIVGRPRPDFFWRCFPDGIEHRPLNCTGDPTEIVEGLKSFPSGHSSFSFCSLGFSSLYLCGQMKVFSVRGPSWRLVAGLCPLVLALVIALSRTCDYHHHWQDVLVGGLLGLALAWLCYRQYYPPLGGPRCCPPSAGGGNSEPQEDDRLLVKWI